MLVASCSPNLTSKPMENSKANSGFKNPSRPTGIRAPAVTICAVVAAGCGPAGFADPPPVPSRTAEIEAVVYLIGDAGYAEPGDPVLRHIRDEILELPSGSEAVVVYLGDNIYWNGLHEPSHPNHDKEVGHLEAQIDLVRGTAARGIFVPGNHDWGYKGERGLLQIRRQGEYLAAVASDNTKVTMLPAAGCPGPDAVPLAESVLLVPIDTDLWLGGHVPADDCRPATLDEALDSLGAVLSRNEAGDRRHVVAVAHHPLKTYGPHGGYFGLKDQFFPGTNLWDYLYIPLPFLYPIVRNSGVHKGDLSHPRYGRMQDQFAEVLTAFADQPLVWAAGHDHTLQVFHGDEYGVGYILVSGAGSLLDDVGKDDALFAAGRQQREQGYMKLEFLRDRSALLSVITDGTASCRDEDDCPGEPMLRYWRRITGR